MVVFSEREGLATLPLRDLAPGETTPPYYGPGQPGHGKVFVANALFVEGARPDVEAVLERLGIAPEARAEVLAPERFVALARALAPCLAS